VVGPVGTGVTSPPPRLELSTCVRIGDKASLMSVAELADRSPYHGYRFPAEIIAHAVWLLWGYRLGCQALTSWTWWVGEKG
jgi:hypothetical protein